MKKLNKKLILGGMIAVLAIIAVVGASCCKCGGNKIAVVNLTQVVKADPAAVTLRVEQAKAIDELSKWLDKAGAEVKAEKKKVKQAEMAQEYREMAIKKEAAIKQAYQAKLKEIDNRLSGIMNDIAKEKGCSVILDSKSVVQGGINITDDVIKAVTKK